VSTAASVYCHPRVIAILFLGFASGLPLALTASTLGVWLTESGISLSTIGVFSAVGTPYALKFLWAPLIDGTNFPVLSRLLGRRRGWMVAMQLALMASIASFGLLNPVTDTFAFAMLALLTAIFSASQDTVIDAYRVEILSPEQYGAGAANAVLGYRLGMIVSSAGPLFIYKTIGWPMTYGIMAALMAVGMVTVLLMGEPTHTRSPLPGNWLQQHVMAPIRDFATREHWLLILLFILLYKLADAFMGMVTNPFLLSIGFTGPQIGTVLKVYGVIATIVGSFIGGSLVFRLGMVRSLWICGIAHALTNLMFVAQAHVGSDVHFLAASITLQNVSGGMGTAAFVAYISNLCNLRFTATQYALLSSLSAFGRTWLSTPAGWVATQLGWAGFFLFAAALAVPGLYVLWLLNRRINNPI